MKFFSIVTFFCGLALALPDALAVQQGSVMPQVKLAGDHKTLDTAGMKGKVTLVNFWATWCESCKVELKEMEHLFAQFRDNPKVQIAFVSVDKDAAKAKSWVRDHLRSPQFVAERLYLDPKFEAAEALGVDSFPITLIIDQDQKIQHVQNGFKESEKSTEKMASMLKELSAKSAAAAQ